MNAALLLGVLSSLAVVHSQENVKNVSACFDPPGGDVTFTIFGQPGPAGPRGLVGPKGSEGAVGKRGVTGLIGPVGSRGDPGLPGAVGRTGPRGVEGPRGNPGISGSHGPAGPPGLAGVRGSPGPMGLTGTCNFSDAVYQNLTRDIRANLTEDVMSSVGNVLLPIFELVCTQYLKGFNGQLEERPASSCKHIYQCSLYTAPSGYYWIARAYHNGSINAPGRMYCAMDLTDCGSTTGGWTRVAYINMTDPTETCPTGGLRYIHSPKRMCGRSYNWPGCRSVTLPSYEGSYNKVCGRALGYQCESTRAFYSYHHRGQSSINGYYVDGLSVTYGYPRQHVWTFASGFSKDEKNADRCPCTSGGAKVAPDFIGNDFFCESGNAERYSGRTWYLDDPLWDGQGCARSSTCCDGPHRPWFYRELNSTATENVEVRLCFHDDGQANIGVEELEIYVS